MSDGRSGPRIVTPSLDQNTYKPHRSRVARPPEQSSAHEAQPGRRPVDERSPAHDVDAGDKAEEPAVLAVTAVVTKDEDLADGHFLRTVAGGARTVAARERRRIEFLDGCVVDEHHAITKFDRLAAESHHPLHEIFAWIEGVMKDDHVSAFDGAKPIRQLTDQDAVADHERRLHRARRNVECLDDKRDDEQAQQRRDDAGVQCLNDRASPVGRNGLRAPDHDACDDEHARKNQNQAGDAEWEVVEKLQTHRGRKTRPLATLLDAGLAPDFLAQIVELRLANLALADDINAIDAR